MTDYHPLIARAVEGLDRSTGEARRALYERARNALVAQLRSNQLSEADINKERLALEKAIRKVEAEAARKSRSESRSEPRATTPPATTPDGGAQVRRASGAPRWERANPSPADLPRAEWSAVLPSARDRLLSGRSSLKKQGVKAAQTARHAREAYEAEALQILPAQEPAAPSQRFELNLDAEDINSSTTIRGRNATSSPPTSSMTSSRSPHHRRAARRRKRNTKSSVPRFPMGDRRDFSLC